MCGEPGADSVLAGPSQPVSLPPLHGLARERKDASAPPV
jgi:hypothetical protein